MFKPYTFQFNFFLRHRSLDMCRQNMHVFFYYFVYFFMKERLNWKEEKHCERKLKRAQFEIEATETEKVLREVKTELNEISFSFFSRLWLETLKGKMNFFYFFINFKLTWNPNMMRVLWDEAKVDDDCGMTELLFHIEFQFLSIKLLFSSIFSSEWNSLKKQLTLNLSWQDWNELHSQVKDCGTLVVIICTKNCLF